MSTLAPSNKALYSVGLGNGVDATQWTQDFRKIAWTRTYKHHDSNREAEACLRITSLAHQSLIIEVTDTQNGKRIAEKTITKRGLTRDDVERSQQLTNQWAVDYLVPDPIQR